jgi:hypothetical protein
MSENLREQSSWRKGKTPLILKYNEDHAKILSEIAGRGFLSLPGYAHDLENQIETTAKMGLSELNYKILSETVERELKQTGFDYGLAYKNAVMTWELEKQALLSAWAAEYSGIKQIEAEDEETLDRLAIEVGKRAIILLEGKTAIEIEAETFRTTLAQLDGTVAPYEVLLANAKLLTAQRKLEIIPILQEILTKEQELLVIEQRKAAAYTLYIAAEREVAAKKQTLAPVLIDLATHSENLANEILTVQIPIEGQIADEKIDQASIAVQKAGYQVHEMTAEVDAANKTLELMDAKRSLQEARFADEQSLVTKETTLTEAYSDRESDNFDTIIEAEREAQQTLIDNKTTVHTTQSNIRTTSAETITSNEIRTSNDIKDLENLAHIGKANAEAAAKITAGLEHIIG